MIWLLPWEEENDVKHVHWALYALIAINVAVFLWEVTATDAALEAFFAKYALDPANPQAFQYITANFLHGGWMHLIGNMIFLYLFGDNVEDVLGPIGFLLLYVAGGVLGDALFVSANGASHVGTIGASGCIATIAGAYAVFFSDQKCSVRLMVLVFPVLKLHMRAFWLLLLWFGTDVARTAISHGSLEGAGPVNFVAHGVGFAVGFFAAMFARIYGVMRRYHLMPVGHALFGYWPSDQEAAFRREERMRAARARARLGFGGRDGAFRWRR